MNANYSRFSKEVLNNNYQAEIYLESDELDNDTIEYMEKESEELEELKTDLTSFYLSCFWLLFFR